MNSFKSLLAACDHRKLQPWPFPVVIFSYLFPTIKTGEPAGSSTSCAQLLTEVLGLEHLAQRSSFPQSALLQSSSVPPAGVCCKQLGLAPVSSINLILLKSIVLDSNSRLLLARRLRPLDAAGLGFRDFGDLGVDRCDTSTSPYSAD